MPRVARSTVVSMMSSTRRAFERLLEWDISTVKQYAVQKGLYTAEEIDTIEAEYKKYLALCIGYPATALPTPTKLDDLWHQHILFTRDYHTMCQSVGGRYLHHEPFVGDVKVDPKARSQMRIMYLREFGRQPNTIWLGDGLCSPNPNCQGKS